MLSWERRRPRRLAVRKIAIYESIPQRWLHGWILANFVCMSKDEPARTPALPEGL
jgi:hypothetical protein